MLCLHPSAFRNSLFNISKHVDCSTSHRYCSKLMHKFTYSYTKKESNKERFKRKPTYLRKLNTLGTLGPFPFKKTRKLSASGSWRTLSASGSWRKASRRKAQPGEKNRSCWVLERKNGEESPILCWLKHSVLMIINLVGFAIVD